MNIVQEAIRRLKFNIPEKILELAFSKQDSWYYNTPISIDTVIRRDIIDARILPDLNMVGGQEVQIPLQGLEFIPFNIPTDMAQVGSIVTIPPERRNGRRIISVKGIGFGIGLTQKGLGYGGNAFFDAAREGMNHVNPTGLTATHEVIMLNENQVMIKGAMFIPIQAVLNCVVGNDENLSNINPRSGTSFYKLVELATKGYIYNKLIVTLDQGYLQGGMQLGTIKEIIDGYSDAASIYAEEIEAWYKIAIFNDEGMRKKHIGLISGNI